MSLRCVCVVHGFCVGSGAFGAPFDSRLLRSFGNSGGRLRALPGCGLLGDKLALTPIVNLVAAR
eukprot:14925608-Alexandrium_andersonii.AAC.1